MIHPSKHIQVEISRRAFGDNIEHLRSTLAPSRVCVVMKSNAYGHGLGELVDTAVDAGADYIGVCTNDEALLIRQRHPEQPLMRLRAALPEELAESVDHLDMEEIVGSAGAAEFLDRLGRRRGRPVPVHLKVDIGMGRTGFLPTDRSGLLSACGKKGLAVRGIMTHLPVADGPVLDETINRLDEFNSLVDSFADVLPAGVIRHSHNSAATIRLPETRGDMVRVGAACFGVRTSTHFSNPPELRPVMSVKTRVMEVRDVPAGWTIGYGSLYRTARASRIASLPVGFGEGYPRALFNKGVVLIGGQRCPVVGRVSLNVTTVDVTHLAGDVTWGDEAVLVGRQGGQEITFEELADLFDSVHTEINLMAGLFNRPSYLD